MGGVLLYEATRREGLDFFIHCGDRIYADQPLKAVKGAVGGKKWYNLLTPEVQRVAETLDDFRGYFRYTLLDEPTKRFYQVCPQLFVWDDHEVRNDWFPGERIRSSRYRVKEINELARYAKRAFYEYSPFPEGWLKAPRLYRQRSYGPALDVFILDGRSHRGPNTREAHSSEELSGLTQHLGPVQLEWLKRSLSASRATWKVIVCPQPLALMIGSRGGGYDGVSSGSGGVTGRELEINALLKHLHLEQVKGVVWLSADVHYAAAHHFHPERGSVGDFTPFWEFVAGPINAATLGPKRLDPTFGPRVDYLSVKDSLRRGLSPLDHQQFYGMGEVDPITQQLHITLHNLTGELLYRRTLSPPS
jgi:alkaline phosphatase D